MTRLPRLPFLTMFTSLIGAGSILLVGREPDPPYNRPDLSKKYLMGKKAKEDVLFRPNDWWDEQSIELMTRTSVTGLDVNERVAKLLSMPRADRARSIR